MAVLTVQDMTLAGLDVVLVAADVAGDLFANDGRTFFLVDNADASPINVTINSVEECSQGFDHDIVVAVPNGESRYIGPFNTKRFNNATAQVSVTYSAVTSVTVAAVQV